MIDPRQYCTRTLFGIGRNYAAHARELGNPLPTEPVVFLKPASALLYNGGTIRLPPESSNVQHELELVLLLGAGGRHLSIDQAWRAIAGYGIGIDVTARDLQRKAQAAGNPWSIAKGFDTFAPISTFVASESIANPHAIGFELRVNGKLRQTGNSGEMLFNCGEIVAYLSTIFTLYPGDLIFTGSPEGVGTIRPGDRLVARFVDGSTSLEVDAAPPMRG
ncbi:MAG: fumarylacetoacetate hydrolase family protein [Gammaproteobacteria bacterium]|nr:fumarylacetoacetate hydrolase family protein [Gammaproteobacteria bacterium]